MRWSESPITDPTLVAGLVVIGIVVSALGSAWAIAHGHRKGMLDHPGDRRSHDTPTPRGGGIGIVLAALIAVLAISALASNPASWLLVALGLLLVAGIGWWDDHRPLPAWPRLVVHVVAAACLGGALHQQGAAATTVLAALLLALVLVNAWNFVDGINGLATSQALLCALGFAAVLDGPWQVLALVLAAACLGFLPFNFPRARVFLGDVGSGALGYLLAAVIAAGLASQPMAWWPLLLVPPMTVLVDTALTLLWRMLRREHWWRPHVQHAFQRWSRVDGHARVCLGYAVWTFAAVAIMLAALHWPTRVSLGAAPASLLASAWVWRWLHRRYDKNHTEGFGT